jgi:hypothetical protein
VNARRRLWAGDGKTEVIVETKPVYISDDSEGTGKCGTPALPVSADCKTDFSTVMMLTITEWRNCGRETFRSAYTL